MPSRRIKRTNGWEVFYQSRPEVLQFYEDIFVDQAYCRHGGGIETATHVLDVGANIGLFSLYAAQNAVEARIFAFEPAPDIFSILEANTARYAGRIRTFPFGLGDHDAVAPFTYYEHSSGMSSFHADLEEEREVLRRVIGNQEQLGKQALPDRDLLEGLLDARLASRTLACRIRRTSEVIRELGIQRIDFMKIDVQKSEHEVLAGIDEGQWKSIGRIVVEVHDNGGKLQNIVAQLEEKGFVVVAEQEPLYRSSWMYNVFAWRREWPPSEAGGPGLGADIERRARLQAAAIHRRARKE